MTTSPERSVAVHALQRFMERGVFVTDSLLDARAKGMLLPKRSGLAREIALGAVRHGLTIRALLERVARYDEHRVKPPLRAALHAAAYQLIWMDGVPDYAAVDQAVGYARVRNGPRAAGMVNAVLRRVLRGIDTLRAPWRSGDPRHIRVNWSQACVFNCDVLPSDASQIALASGIGSERWDRWSRTYGKAAAESAAWASQAIPPIVLQRNATRITPEEFESLVRDTFGAEASFHGEAVFIPAHVRFVDTRLIREGLAFVQDATAHAAAKLLDAKPDQYVLDLCAAPGGKSMALAGAMMDRGRILACDVSRERLARVEENANRLGLSCVKTHLMDAEHAAANLPDGPFDAALVDAPCSNSGVLARRPEARCATGPKQFDALAVLQGRLLQYAASQVRSHGRLVYSTCSIEPDENERVVQRFLDENARWECGETFHMLPAWSSRISDWRDGGYAVLLIRVDA